MNRVYLVLFLTAQLAGIFCINENGIIRDYFTFRKVKRIVGFSCGDLENDVQLARMFNDMYITYISMTDMVAESPEELKQLLSAEYHQLGIFLDCRCDTKRYTQIFIHATRYSMYDELHKWLILGSNMSHSLQMLQDQAFTVSTDIIIAIPSATGYTMYDVYNPCKDRGGTTNVTIFGTWNVEDGLNVTLTQSKFQRRSNLHGMKLRVGIVISYSSENTSLHDMMMDYSMKARYGRTKFLYLLLNHLSDLFNFTMDTVQINARRRFDNSGPVFTAFKKKLVDLSASPVAMKINRLNNGDIIGPVWPMRSCFMFRTISSMKVTPSQFLKPLSPKVWYGILFMIGMVTCILILIIKMEGVRDSVDTYGLSVILTIGALAQQGSPFVPARIAARIAFLQILLFSVLILNYYSASVVSNRLKNKGHKMDDSLLSLTKSNIKLAVEPTPYIRSFLGVPDKQVRYFYQHRWSKIPEYNRYLPLEEGLDRVAQGTLAYHTMIDSAYPYIEHTFNDRSICELTEVHLFRTVLAFYARHKSPFTELLRIGLTKIRNVGIQNREWKRWSARKPYCPNNLLIAEPLSIQEAAPIFVFLCFSVGFSLLICIAENFFHWLAPKRISRIMMEKKRLMDKSLNIPSLRDVNMRTLKHLNLFREWMNSQSP